MVAQTSRGVQTRIKVCGLGTLADAQEADRAGAHWLGFIVHGESPRRIEPETMARIVAELPGRTLVAVMVDVSPAEALELARRANANRVQVHRARGDWSVAFPLPVAIAVAVDVTGQMTGSLPASEHLLMLDTSDPVRDGGTGRTFPWEAAAPIARQRPVLLAGGLGAHNVAEAIARVRPFGVDASSQLERAPGVKDSERVRRFIEEVRAADERIGAGA